MGGCHKLDYKNIDVVEIRAKHIDESGMLSRDQLAVYYASYRHLAKMAIRNANKDSKGGMLTN